MIGEDTSGSVPFQKVVEAKKSLLDYEGIQLVCLPMILPFRERTSQKSEGGFRLLQDDFVKFGRGHWVAETS